MKTSQLRASILQQAVEGKLVPQKAEEGTAKALLADIRAEREALIKAGKIKKAKPLPEITEEEIPFEIPETWEWVRLGDALLSTDAGKSPDCKEGGVSGNEWGVIKTTAIQLNKFLEEENKKLPASFVLKDSYVIHNDDVIITRAGPRNRTGVVCCVEGLTKNLILSDKTVRLLLAQNTVFPKFLSQILNSPIVQDNIFDKFVGMASSQVNISQDKIKEVLLPLPPLAEQKRIVAKLEELMPLIDAYEKEETKLSALEKSLPEKLRRSVLQQAVEGKLVPQKAEEGTAAELLKEIEKERATLVKAGKMKKAKPLPEIEEEEIPFEIPETWEWVRLGELSVNIHYGFTASAGVCGNAKLLRITDIQNNSVDWNTVPLCSINESERTRYSLNSRDILIARSGSVGKTYLVKNLPRDLVSVFASYLIRFIPFENLNVTFLKLVMESPLYWSQLKKKARGTGVENVNSEDLKTMYVVLPPLAEQKRIVAKVEELMKVIDQL